MATAEGATVNDVATAYDTTVKSAAFNQEAAVDIAKLLLGSINRNSPTCTSSNG